MADLLPQGAEFVCVFFLFKDLSPLIVVTAARPGGQAQEPGAQRLRCRPDRRRERGGHWQ